MSAAPALACASLEVALNRYLAIEPAALEDCARLADRSVALSVAGLEWELFVEFHAGGVRVTNERAGPASVRLRGAPGAYARLGGKLVRGGDAALPEGLSVDGDAEVLQRFRRLLARVGFDLEEQLAPLLGGATAHRAAQGLRSFFGWGRATAGTLALDTAEYLREETRDLARGVDVEDWMREVDTLRERADRFEARLQRLERRRSQPA